MANVIDEHHTVVDLFRQQARELGPAPALRHHADGAWRTISWDEYGRTVDEAAAGLIALGIEPGDRVGLLAANQPRWHMADVAILSAGAVSVPAYPTGTASQVAHVLGHSGARLCFVGDRDQLAKVLVVVRHLPHLEHVVMLGQPPDGLDGDLLVTFEGLRARGRELLGRAQGAVEDRVGTLGPSSLATIVYTSGTTGRPKGVRLTHANVTQTIRAVTAVVPVGPTDRFLSFLPLSHIAERIVSHVGQIVAGGETWFARGLATLGDDLRACQPTVFFAVPRVWEKFQAAILDQVASSPRPVRAVAERYLALGRRRVDAHEVGTLRPLREVLAHVALDRIVGQRIRRRLGLDQARIFVSSAAPVHPDLLRWFHAVGIPVAEAFGLTEACGPTTMSLPARTRVGTVGRALPGVRLRIAADGEVQVHGPTVCAGYHDDPDATAALLGADGWLRTGDVGRLDPDGYLRITGRKKDLIITSSGKNVAPQDLETALAADPLVSQAVVVGDGRPYLTALLALDADAAARHVAALDGDGREHGDGDGRPDAGLTGVEALAGHPSIQGAVGRTIQRLNASRAPIERLKTWRIIPRDLTVAGGELTPTFKVRRNAVADHFAELVAEMYVPTPRSAAR